ncbi:unnamed protein product [Cylicostephanus goldi]|uniref:Anaphase-promoting complex subunit 4 WD40 domain-containing protein n=1 Tax=Cylicostephanus goldi TaxID=71465 RepID=A0A3P6R3M0_CYLGO|nr:unnamed protein product [Cylicostephanus goldi]
MLQEVWQVVWHSKGDYLATVAVDDIAASVYIHQLSRARSQCPFTKRKGHVQVVAFHPTLPRFFVATKIHVRVYDLGRCQLVKKCITGIKHIGAMIPDVQGEVTIVWFCLYGLKDTLAMDLKTDGNLFVGGLDRKFVWLDLQLSNKPWKSFKHHNSAIRGVAYHNRYPLLATVSDDGTAMVYYARIHVDSFKDNEIYPVKRLRGHTTMFVVSVERISLHIKVDGLSMLDTVWHPTQPWLITAGADGTIALFSY